jgi:hypothetical protein
MAKETRLMLVNPPHQLLIIISLAGSAYLERALTDCFHLYLTRVMLKIDVTFKITIGSQFNTIKKAKNTFKKFYQTSP